MPKKDVSQSVRSLVRAVIVEAIKEMRASLPARRQLIRLEARLRSIERGLKAMSRRKGRGTGRVGRPRINPPHCRVRGCEAPARAKSLCSRHYQQRRRMRLAGKGAA
jgi:hypothetical protein